MARIEPTNYFDVRVNHSESKRYYLTKPTTRTYIHICPEHIFGYGGNGPSFWRALQERANTGEWVKAIQETHVRILNDKTDQWAVFEFDTFLFSATDPNIASYRCIDCSDLSVNIDSLGLVIHQGATALVHSFGAQ